MAYMIETQNLTKRYGTFMAVNKVNLHVPKGKIYGLLGRNGAGKTTLMSMLLRLTAQTSGEIKLLNKAWDAYGKDAYSRIGSIIETPGFYENLTGKENLEMLARLRGLHKKDKVVAHALQIVGLTGEYEKTFGQYSLGMKQRLGIAAALMHDPELLILDEPINGLDPVGIATMRKYLETLSREKGVTILISSHILGEIQQMADVIGVMNKGQLVEEVAMEELKERCQKYVEFEVSDPQAAISLLREYYQITDYELTEHTIKIHEMAHNLGEINKTFVDHDILVTKINRLEDNLEDYFSELIGGEGIA